MDYFFTMKEDYTIGRLIGKLIKYGPIIYPIVRKFVAKRKQNKHRSE